MSVFIDQVSDEKSRLRNQVAQQLYDFLPLPYRITQLETIMKREGIGKLNDPYACMVFAMWVIAWEDYDRHGPERKGVDGEFLRCEKLDRLRDLYLCLPAQNHDRASLGETRKAIISEIAALWEPSKHAHASRYAFELVWAIGWPEKKGRWTLPVMENEWTEAERQMEGSYAHPSERKHALDCLRTKLDGCSVNAGTCIELLDLYGAGRFFPEEVANLIVMALARIGKLPFVQALLRYWRFQEGFAVADRSGAAYVLARMFMEELAILDGALQELVKEMGGGTSGIERELIGGSERVFGDIDFVFREADWANIQVRIPSPDICSKGLAACICSRARRHLLVLVDDTLPRACPGRHGIRISLTVSGDQLDTPYTQEFRVK